MKRSHEIRVFEDDLRRAGFRVTPARLAVLRLLHTKKHPIGIEVIQKELPEINTVTLYRMMSDFTEKYLVHAHDLGHGHVDYELGGRPHHHHIVCEQCGKIEDVHPCGDACVFEKAVLASSRAFRQIKQQQVTFFGLCNTCHK